MVRTSRKNKLMSQVVISLTSFPAAIGYATEAIKSLLKGSILPDKIVLYVTLAQFEGKRLPDELLRLQSENPIFEIRDYERDIRSYRKLVPALKDFPDATIVTVDDDVHYHPDMLKTLLKWHERYPDSILAHRAKKIVLGKPYKKWMKFRWYHFLLKKIYKKPLIMQTGVAGVLYPPRSLRADMLEENIFTQLAPTTDDIWFWAAAVANNRRIIPVPFGYNKPKGLGKPKSISLKTFNFKAGEDNNSKALNAVLSRYPEIKKKIAEID